MILYVVLWLLVLDDLIWFGSVWHCAVVVWIRMGVWTHVWYSLYIFPLIKKKQLKSRRWESSLVSFCSSIYILTCLWISFNWSSGVIFNQKWLDKIVQMIVMNLSVVIYLGNSVTRHFFFGGERKREIAKTYLCLSLFTISLLHFRWMINVCHQVVLR